MRLVLLNLAMVDALKVLSKAFGATDSVLLGRGRSAR